MTKPKVDFIFLFSVLALSATGLIMIFSASPTLGIKLGDSFYYLKRHLFYLLLGYTALYFGARLDLAVLKKWSSVIFLVTLLLLFMVFIPGVGRKISGAFRWIDFYFISFQPSELMKFSMILFLSTLLSNMGERIKNFVAGLLPILLLVGAVFAVIMLQPDLGTAICVAESAFILLFAAAANLWHLGALGAIGLGGIVALSLTSAYRLKRLVAYLDPWQDPQGTGFHIIQSLLAVGSGGIFGLGLGASRQKFFYLPQQFTDFIFAILCEELGFVGGAGVVLLFVIFTIRGLRIALRSAEVFEFFLATGLVSWIALQAMINIMVVVGLIPTTGIPLPFISYGGTATIICLFSAGILLNISYKQT